MRMLRVSSGIFALVSAVMMAQQQDVPKVLGGSDRGVRIPQARRALGEKDESALRLVREFLRQSESGGVTTCASGSMSGPALGGGARAEITVDASGRSRLDLSTLSGTRSIRMNGPIGGVVMENGAISRFPASTSRAGFFLTPEMLSSLLQDPLVALSDDGTVVVDGTSYRAVTIVRPLIPGRKPTALTPPIVTQLLFDAQNHFLLKTVDSIISTESSPIKHIRVITFAGYARSAGHLSPETISETHDGRPVWTLKLAGPRVDCQKTAEFFNLEGAK